MLDLLPHELILHTLCTLDLVSLRALRLASKSWHAFFVQYREAIYRAAAILHDFVEPGVLLKDVHKAYATRWLDDASSWEEICKQFVHLDSAWKGRWHPPAQRTLAATGPRAHRFKVVPEDRVAVVTVGRAEGPGHKDLLGNLLVVDLEADCVLWALPKDRVRPYAHCEYDAGFLVFDRPGSSLEVWRRASHHTTLPAVPVEALADVRMRAAADEAFRADADSPRGVFEPHALLHVPALGLAYHLVGTTLVVASQLARKAFVFDVAHGVLVETLDCAADSSVAQDWEHIFYVDVDPARRRVLLATDLGLFVCKNVSARTERQLVAHIPKPGDTCYWTSEKNREQIVPCDGSDAHNFMMVECCVEQGVFSWGNYLLTETVISAAHVSPCGQHLAMLSQCALVIVRNYMSAWEKSVHILELPDYVDAQYLAFDGRHIAVGMGEGVLVTDVELHNVVWLQPNVEQTHEFSCVQLTKDALWVTWGEPAEPGMKFPASLLCFDFGASASRARGS